MSQSRPETDDARMEVAELQALLDAAVDGIVIIDEAGVIGAFNLAAERMFGYEASQVIGGPVELLMPEPHKSRHRGYMRRYLETRDPHVIGRGREVEGRHSSGRIFPIHLAVGEAVSAGYRQFVGIIRDLSSQRATEERTRSLENRLAQVDRFSLMGEMAAGIAHEINQPLSAIATYAQAAKRLVAKTPLDRATLADVSEKIDEQARRAGDVIRNLRKLARKHEISKERLDANGLVSGILNLIEADAHVEGIPVMTEFAEDLPEILGDALQLQQVLLNLTRNSVDAMRDGLHNERGILINTERTSNGVSISVTDHGHGVSSHLGGSIFNPFVTTKREGLGVGLAISSTIVEACGGRLSYENNDVGATFTITLPDAADGDDA
jgi:two-component system, LuxR family, sensor kinase FixL